ncbi:MAG TPA: ornithine cyclodeaminase family protein [Myxococcales bacterium]|nr:ornithine cyclodeaminase family protein [Myxococcales bacterium]
MDAGSIVFTAGAATGTEQVLGFRAYDTFRGAGTDTDQVVAVFDARDGQLKGLVIGSRIGALRTGALGGVAIKHLANPSSSVLAVLGAGAQARSQIEAALAVREVSQLLLSSRTVASAELLRDEILEQYQLDCMVATSPRDAVAEADIVICATSSTSPVLESGWIKPGAHVSTVGPKLFGAQELPSDFGARCAVVTTDSLKQVEAYGRFFLTSGPAPIGLEQIIAGKFRGRANPDDITLYCSVGLAGTEVVLANEVLRRAAS